MHHSSSVGPSAESRVPLRKLSSMYPSEITSDWRPGGRISFVRGRPLSRRRSRRDQPRAGQRRRVADPGRLPSGPGRGVDRNEARLPSAPPPHGDRSDGDLVFADAPLPRPLAHPVRRTVLSRRMPAFRKLGSEMNVLEERELVPMTGGEQGIQLDVVFRG